MSGKIGDISNLKKGKKITIGSLSDLAIVRKIGEGGSAFVYTARQSTRAAVAVAQSTSTSVAPVFPRSPAPISDSASVAGYNVTASHLGDEDGASVMSYAPGGGSNLTPSRRRSRRSRLFSPSKSLRHLSSSSLTSTRTDGNAGSSDLVVIKATSTSGSPTRKRQAEKEIEVLLRLRNRHHPNIVQILDWTSVKCTTTSNGLVTLCAMEYCAGGSLMDIISDRRERLLAERAVRQKSGGRSSPGLSTEWDESSATATHGNGNKFLRKLRRHANADGLDDEIPPPPPPLPAPQLVGDAGNRTSYEAYFDYEDILSIFQQASSALRFLHNSFDVRPLVHRDVKPENLLLIPTNINQMETILPGMHRWTVRLCDFGSVVEGNQPLRTPTDRMAAEDVIQKSTTQMYRAPEMVNVHSVQELTAKTDIWALGCTLYMACYLQNCFEENSSLAILSGKYLQPPDDHPYSQTSLREIIDRMLTVNVSRRAGIDEVCKCFDRLLVGKNLPKRTSGRKTNTSSSASTRTPKKTSGRAIASARDSPPPPPPPPRPPKHKAAQEQAQKEMTSISDPIPSSVFVDRRSVRPTEHTRTPLDDCGGLVGEKILMQSVPEDTAMRSHRDPRKNYGRNRSNITPSLPTAMDVDHIYNDLLQEEPTKRNRRKSKKKIATKTSERIEDELDRISIRIFTSTDEVEIRATGGSDSVSFDSTPPLSPLEMSIASLSSEDHYSFSRESPARRNKGRVPSGTQGRATVRDPPGTSPSPSYF